MTTENTFTTLPTSGWSGRGVNCAATITAFQKEGLSLTSPNPSHPPDLGPASAAWAPASNHPTTECRSIRPRPIVMPNATQLAAR